MNRNGSGGACLAYWLSLAFTWWFDPHSYPHYVIVSANGIVEVIEHRKMEPVFYVTDDPSIISAF